jgi:hypothetical protein
VVVNAIPIYLLLSCLGYIKLFLKQFVGVIELCLQGARTTNRRSERTTYKPIPNPCKIHML